MMKEGLYQKLKKGKNRKKYKKLESGISEKLCCADIERKCKWPSSMLDGIFEDEEIPFKELTISQFLCGELCIWDRPKTNRHEIKARRYLIKKMLKNEPKLGFEKCKEIYKTFLMRIEKGFVSWKNITDIDRIETEIVLKCISFQEKGRSGRVEFIKKIDTIWCKDFNKGTCNQADNHEQMFQGKLVRVSHICRKCFSKKKEKNRHREMDSQCPFHE